MKRNPCLATLRAAVCVASALPTFANAQCSTQVTASGTASTAQASHRLIVKISGIRNDRGEIQIALFQTAKGFPDNDADAVAHQSVRVAPGGGTTTVVFPDLKPGQYAIALFHDENDNGTLDTSLGFPLEGFGTSNNPPLHWRPPGFNESRFELNRDRRDTAITIQMRYLTENSPD